MSQGIPPGYVLPTPQRAKLVGTLNIVFASLILIYVLIMFAMIFISPMLTKMSSEMMKQAQAKIARDRNDKLAALKLEAAAAKTAEEKAELNRRIGSIQASPVVTMPDIEKMTKEFNTPGYRAWTWVDITTGFALNVAMMAAGIGLLRFKEKSRRLAIWTFALKMLRLSILTAVAIFVIIPVTSKLSADIASGAAPKGPGAPPFVLTAQFQAIVATSMAVISLLLGCIWPIAGMILLTRPGTRAACRMSASKPVAGVQDLP